MDLLTSLLKHCNKKRQEKPGNKFQAYFPPTCRFRTACSYANLSKIHTQALLQGKTLDFVFVIECTSGVAILSAKTFTLRKLPTDAYGTRPTPIQDAA
ncbi:hypothetical protein MTR_4g083315 [Medicago truncatula]|uniref:Uncharacterized protein n=1 Tax=Medicago truncatula TaxID=3880 RepID=A0A072UP72_MEDTR|nr:hypothetical protein MTR_4g083315 [Medicago truncatula]